MSAPARQRSLRERLHGIGFSWQGKKSKSYSSKDSKPYVDTEGPKSQSLDVGVLSGVQEKEPTKDSAMEKEPDATASQGAGEASGSQSDRKHLTRSLTQPKGTVEYVVKASDTLPGIAARFDTTPSELAKLNRLASRLIFPGQVLFVPEKNGKEGSPKEPGAHNVPFLEKQISYDVEGKPKISASGDHRKLSLASLGEKDSMQVPDPSRLYARRCSERVQKFLKLKGRHITDGRGIVTGILLVTPNAVMFDPNVSDPLVLEQGPEAYSVVAPMEMIMRTAIYYDIAHMKVKHIPDEMSNLPEAEIYYGRMSRNFDDASVESKSSTDSKTRLKEEAETTAKEECSSDQPDQPASDTQPSSSDPTPSVHAATTATATTITTTLATTTTTTSTVAATSLSDSKNGALSEPLKSSEQIKGPETSQPPPSETIEQCDMPKDKSKEEVKRTEIVEGTPPAMEKSLSSDSQVGLEKPQSESRRERMLKRLSYPMESITSISKILSSSPKSLVDFSSGLFVRTSDEDAKAKDVSSAEIKEEKELEETEEAKEVPDAPVSTESKEEGKEVEQKDKDSEQAKGSSDPLPLYKNMVEEKLDIFEALDKLIQRPPQESEDQPPLYLWVRMGRPVEKKVKPGHVLAFRKKKIKREYWFSVTHERVEDLYTFLQHWAPHLYGSMKDMDPEQLGLIPIEDAEEEEEAQVQEIEEDEEGNKDDPSKKPRASPLQFIKLVEDHFGLRSISPTDWEVLSISDAEKVCCLENLDLPLPELLDKSDILEEEHIKELCNHLPARAVGYSWTLIYSTSQHGFNLKTLYRNMSFYETPILLVICDINGAIFGAVTSCSLKTSDHFYGTGESFLYTFYPEFKCYFWTGENMYFIKGDTDSIAIGAGDGQFGIWLDGDLYHGRSNKCKTYDNDALASTEDFVIKTLEAWGFV